MITPIEILGITAVVFSNLIAYFVLRRLKQSRKRKERDRLNQPNSYT